MGADINRVSDAGVVAITSGAWRNTNAVTSITIAPNNNNWMQYTQFALYGVKG